MDREDDLSFYYMNFHPYYGGQNPNHYPGSDSQTLTYLKSSDRRVTPEKADLLKRISDWLKDILDNLDIVVAIVPGHSPQSPPNFLHPIIGNFIKGNVKDGRDLLIRTREVPKAAHDGSRSQSLHEESIQVTDPSKVKDKVVYIIDDIRTTGATLGACASLMRRAGATDVKLLAVGKTVSMQHDD